MSKFVSPVGNVELETDCTNVLNRNTPSRESVITRDDLQFYFHNFLVPKYNLENINVANSATFLKELEMNWSKLTPELKNNVMDILVDHILPENYDFKNELLKRLNISESVTSNMNSSSTPSSSSINKGLDGKSTFGKGRPNVFKIIIIVLCIVFLAGTGYLLLNHNFYQN